MAKGVLKINVVEAKKLKNEDFIGKSDPYVKLILDKGNIQVTKIKDNDLNPKFNEKFTFNVNDQKKLKVQIWDKDTIGSDDLIGEDDIDLSEVISKNYVDAWFDLTKGIFGFRSRGEVHLIMEFIPK
ncbi:hypothetical protein RclHR1_02410011 [Rhizophagus clarus]|uniref:Synaptotagmin-5-like isoform X2 n=1 Tax=Rhizophagus clarus TaxID=94130 RepID=A0A2Z6QYS3_9GLOM|nr:hypothetical protein RclHR1_02410011 [Rhizophagus clarus]GET00541.1 synaptotagmin-5-like isoform X2 [Rhizophagus clarus]